MGTTQITAGRLTHLQRLEAEAIHIMREAVAEAERPALLYSMGKDSSVLLHLLAKGYSNKAMARSLLLSEPTIKLHLTALRRIFNASNRTEVLSKAMKLGFLPV